MFDYASNVFSVSHYMTEKLIEFGADKNKIIYNPYGPGDIFFSCTPDYQSNSFLAIGRFAEKKAPYLTILAFKKVYEKYPKVQLKIVGTGELYTICRRWPQH